jgi:hypothetical protein
MIAGTSTGGIIALGHGKTAADILQVYIERGNIFPPANALGRWYRLIRQGRR